MNHNDHTDHGDHRPNRRFDPIPAETERIVREILGAAIEVHRQLGPGFLEPAYARAMRIELESRRLRVEIEASVQVRYRGKIVCSHKLDFLVEGQVVIEIKAVRKLRPIHHAQVLSYLKASGCRVGLLMNFNEKTLIDGLRRFVR